MNVSIELKSIWEGGGCRSGCGRKDLPWEYAVEGIATIGLLMDLQVLLEIGARGEFLVTVLALERLLARVYSLVSY